jgi:endonuclease/exonuclease/phosphatase family metal-dependent hydrolase
MSLKQLIIIIVFLLSVTSISSIHLARADEDQVLQTKKEQKPFFVIPEKQSLEPTTIKVVSLNLAHGRKRSLNQLLLRTETIRKNLDDIAIFLKRENPDIVALQEADAPSKWSGNFNHVEYLAKKSGYSWYLHSKHSESFLGNYGTAILSQLPIKKGMRYDFMPTPPSMQKGFTVAEILLRHTPGEEDELLIDVATVHLDFSRKSNRVLQILDLEKGLATRNNPVIIMGDFNTSWNAEDELLQKLVNSRKLTVYSPGAENLNTYKSKRFDWIFISNCLDFQNYYTASDVLSDHLAVVSEITFSNEHKCEVSNE